MPELPPAYDPTPSEGALTLVERYPLGLDHARRRRDGVHYTPLHVAASVLDLALDALGAPPRSVCDPSCGAGAFLLVVGEQLVRAGVPAAEVATQRLVGLELDPDAAALARRALSDWAASHGADVAAERVRVHVADSLLVDPTRWPDRPAEGFDLVIGNPPFRGQLAADTARDARRRAALQHRFGAVGAYTDDAALFLLAATELLAPDGVAALVQPQSVLSARDAGEVRDRVLVTTRLHGLWAHAGSPFPDAQVQVCAPVLVRRDDATAAAGTCELRWHDGEHEQERRVRGVQPGESWGHLLGTAVGVPELPPLPGPPLATLATATAGFRDEFYALCAAAHDGDPAAPLQGDEARLVTVGMVDPLHLRWGAGTFRLDGRAMVAPRVSLDRLTTRAPRVARWATDRLVPKVLVATQTKVVEAVADARGDCVPVTPTICVQPVDGADVWHLAAALCAPPVSALALRTHLGAARSTGALRWSARAVLEVPLPQHRSHWDRGARLAQQLQHGPGTPGAADPSPPGAGPPDPSPPDTDGLDELAAVMCAAYELDEDHPVLAWWSARRPRR